MTDQIATQIWDSLNDSERHGVRFGLFPSEKMKPTDALSSDDSHVVTCALLRKAEALPPPPAKKKRLTKLDRLLAASRSS